ncbi:MAG: PulJ/GspJ family protein, partial [Plesiomonas shigelloides]
MTRGFTLIELMVSILIGSLIILASGAVLSSVVSFQTTVQENNKVDTAINEILELMERDIKRAGFFMPGKVSLADSNVTHITSLLPVSQSSLT